MDQKPHFYSVSLPRWSVALNAEFPLGILHDAIEAANDFNGIRGPFKRARSSSAARVHIARVAFGGRAFTLYVKEYLFRSAVDKLKHLVRPGRARRAFEAAELLEKNKLTCPAVVALCEQGGLFLPARQFLITLEVPNALPVLDFYIEEPDPRSRAKLSSALGIFVGRMHALGISHGDLRIGNLLVQDNGGRFQFFLLDNERTLRHHRIPRSLRIKNLVQLNMHEPDISAADRRRFFKAYLEHNPGCRREKSRLIREIITLTHLRRRRRRKKYAHEDRV